MSTRKPLYPPRLQAEIDKRHAAALAADEPTYRDPLTGAVVFTAAFLQARGYCCGSGCRHCPYR